MNGGPSFGGNALRLGDLTRLGRVDVLGHEHNRPTGDTEPPSLDKVTGVISGKPKRPGTWTFAVKVVGHDRKKTMGHPATQNTATKVLSILIS